MMFVCLDCAAAVLRSNRIKQETTDDDVSANRAQIHLDQLLNI